MKVSRALFGFFLFFWKVDLQASSFEMPEAFDEETLQLYFERYGEEIDASQIGQFLKVGEGLREKNVYLCLGLKGSPRKNESKLYLESLVHHEGDKSKMMRLRRQELGAIPVITSLEELGEVRYKQDITLFLTANASLFVLRVRGEDKDASKFSPRDMYNHNKYLSSLRSPKREDGTLEWVPDEMKLVFHQK